MSKQKAKPESVEPEGSRSKSKQLILVSPLSDDELEHCVATLMRLTRTKKGKAKLLWMVARLDGWRYDPKHQNGCNWWRWSHLPVRGKLVKVYESQHPNYLEDLNAVRRMEDRLDEKQMDEYGNQMRAVLGSIQRDKSPTDIQMLRASALHRCVGLISHYTREFRQLTRDRERVQHPDVDPNIDVHQAYAWLYPSTR